jgi:HSP20 family molecular chaperone IbpA
MVLENAVQWTKRALSRIGVHEREQKLPITTSEIPSPMAAARLRVPAVDIYEKEDAFQLWFDVPAASTATAHVYWDDVDTLAVHVQRRTENSPGTPWLCEYDESDWFRRVRLSPEVDASRATCSVKNGVLRIVLPLRRTRALTSIPILAIDSL